MAVESSLRGGARPGQSHREMTAKGYRYQFLLASNAKHVDRPTVAQTMPAALEWLWKGYPISVGPSAK
jgi:hypothetical protein